MKYAIGSGAVLPVRVCLSKRTGKTGLGVFSALFTGFVIWFFRRLPVFFDRKK